MFEHAAKISKILRKSWDLQSCSVALACFHPNVQLSAPAGGYTSPARQAKWKKYEEHVPFCPFLQGMSQYAPSQISFSSVQPALGMSSRSFQTAGLWPSNRPGLKIGNTLGATPSYDHHVVGKVLQKVLESLMESMGKWWEALDLGVSMGILLTKPGHGISCDYGAHLTSVHALKKPRKHGRIPEGKVWAASLVSHVTVAHHPSIRKISALNAQHMQSAKSHHGEGLSSKASPTRKQWSMQTCQINPNHASRLKKIAPEPKNTSN